jgi:hypothetical protein
VLPLLDQEGRPTKALSCIAFRPPTGEPPRRFALLDHVVARIGAAPSSRTEGPLPMEMAEPAAPFEAPPRAARPWLRVVK